MHQEDQDQDQQPDSWLASYESECLEQIQHEPNTEEKLLAELNLAEQHFYANFQNSATAIAQLYKVADRQQRTWHPFQTAAVAVTNLYKESVSRLQLCSELAVQAGRLSKTKELATWARKRRRQILREDLMAFLCGKPPPAKSRPGGQSGKPRPPLSVDRNMPRHSHSHNMGPADSIDKDLGTFQQALAVQGLDGAMSNISVGYHSHSPGTESVDELNHLNHFIREEVSRHHGHRKRSTQSQDCVVHDSPARKRSRLL